MCILFSFLLRLIVFFVYFVFVVAFFDCFSLFAIGALSFLIDCLDYLGAACVARHGYWPIGGGYLMPFISFNGLAKWKFFVCLFVEKFIGSAIGCWQQCCQDVMLLAHTYSSDWTRQQKVNGNKRVNRYESSVTHISRELSNCTANTLSEEFINLCCMCN